MTPFLLKFLEIWQKNLSAVHEIWREHCKHYNVNIISLRKFVWSFTRLKDFKSAYRTLQRMVDLAFREDIFLRKSVEGKVYCPQLDIPIPSGSATNFIVFDLLKYQRASSSISDGVTMNDTEGLHCNPLDAEDSMDISTGIELLDDHQKGPIKKILRWSFNDVIHACGKKAELAQQLIVQGNFTKEILLAQLKDKNCSTF
ncbi:hypothetical protein RDABS01_011439 [Bienertia sinuspersici]